MFLKLLRIVKACPENYQDFNLSCVTTTALVSTPRTPRSNYYVLERIMLEYFQEQ